MFIVHAWILWGFFWILPSWQYHLTAGEIFGVLCYLLVHAFLETLLILGLLLLLAAVLPSCWLKDVFDASGTVIVIVVLVAIVVYQNYMGKQPLPDQFLPWLVVCLVLTIVLSCISVKVKFLRMGIAALADRFVVFVYLQIPLLVLATIVVLVRNLI